MVSLGSLWLPILVSAVLVFAVSAIIHMVLKYHNKDHARLPNEDVVRTAIRAGNPAPAQYVIPYCSDMKDMEKPEMKQKYAEGPVVVMNVLRPGQPNMSKYLGQWFLFNLFVSFLIAYVAAKTIPPGTRYLDVFRVVGAVGFLAYSAGQIPESIWMGKPWKMTWKGVFDGLVYGLVTAGTFGWLWPR
jgi:Flp pilus assembly protein TadB